MKLERIIGFSKSEKMEILASIYLDVPINWGREAFIIFEMIEDGMLNDKAEISYYGIKELESWDPFLEVSVNDQLVRSPYGYA